MNDLPPVQKMLQAERMFKMQNTERKGEAEGPEIRVLSSFSWSGWERSGWTPSFVASQLCL